jgi:hypothetical protein
MSKVTVTVDLSVNNAVLEVIESLDGHISTEAMQRLKIAALGSGKIKDEKFEESYVKGILARKWPGRGVRTLKASVREQAGNGFFDVADCIDLAEKAPAGRRARQYERLANAAVKTLGKFKTFGTKVLNAVTESA